MRIRESPGGKFSSSQEGQQGEGSEENRIDHGIGRRCHGRSHGLQVRRTDGTHHPAAGHRDGDYRIANRVEHALHVERPGDVQRAPRMWHHARKLPGRTSLPDASDRAGELRSHRSPPGRNGNVRKRQVGHGGDHWTRLPGGNLPGTRSIPRFPLVRAGRLARTAWQSPPRGCQALYFLYPQHY